MKKTALLGMITLICTMVLTQAVWAATEMDTPDIPSDFSDAAKWPFTHTESCMPAGKEYRSTAYARITNDKKVESVLVTSIDKIIFRYEYVKGDGYPDFGFEFIKTEKGWMRFDLMTEDSYGDLFETYLNKNGVSSESYGSTCAQVMIFKFGKFWDELHKKAGIQ